MLFLKIYYISWGIHWEVLSIVVCIHIIMTFTAESNSLFSQLKVSYKPESHHFLVLAVAELWIQHTRKCYNFKLWEITSRKSYELAGLRIRVDDYILVFPAEWYMVWVFFFFFFPNTILVRFKQNVHIYSVSQHCWAAFYWFFFHLCKSSVLHIFYKCYSSILQNRSFN